MIRVVFDTNLFISALFFGGPPALAYDAGIDGKFRFIFSDELVVELRRVLSYPKFVERLARLDQTVESLISEYLAAADQATPADVADGIVRDPKDVWVLACAVGGKVDYVISGDKDLTDLKQYEGIPIITVASFLEILEK